MGVSRQLDGKQVNFRMARQPLAIRRARYDDHLYEQPNVWQQAGWIRDVGQAKSRTLL